MRLFSLGTVLRGAGAGRMVTLVRGVVNFGIAAILVASGAAAAANPGISRGTVEDLRVSSRTLPFGASPTGNLTHVRLTAVADPSNVVSSCGNTGGGLQYWVLDTDTPSGKNLLATLMLAYTTGRAVRIWGTGVCDAAMSMETVFQVSLCRSDTLCD
jgi:hypothetical protein